MVTRGAQQRLEVYLLTGTVGGITLLGRELSSPENQQEQGCFGTLSGSLSVLCQEMWAFGEVGRWTGTRVAPRLDCWILGPISTLTL